MNLTNKGNNHWISSNSSSFSKYLLEEDNLDEYNYSDSNINETLLLQATLLDSKKDQPCTSPPALGRLREDSSNISQQKSLVFDLCGQLSISSSQYGSSQTDSQEQSSKQIQDLYNICGTLVETLSKLQNKVDKIEEKQTKVKQIGRDPSRNSFQKEVQSRLTYSSLQNSKGCKCESQVNHKDLITGLFDVLQSKSKTNSHRQQNEQLKKQVIRLQITNEELRKQSKRTEAENHRLRQLLKQCQNFNKRLACQKDFQDRAKISRKNSQKLLSQRQIEQFQVSPCFEDDYRMFVNSQSHFSSNNDSLKLKNQNLKENIKFETQIKHHPTIFQTPTSQTHSSTHSPQPKKVVQTKSSFQPQIIFDPQHKVNPQSNIKIVSFQQCKGMEGPCNSPFVRKGGGGVLKPLSDNHSKSFRDLRMGKVKNY